MTHITKTTVSAKATKYITKTIVTIALYKHVSTQDVRTCYLDTMASETDFEMTDVEISE